MHDIYYRIKYKLIDQWKFIYFEIDFEEFKKWKTYESNYSFRKATAYDVKKLADDIFPFLDFKNGEYDKKYLKSPDAYTALLCEKHNKIVNYILIFEDSINSPITNMPIKKEFLKNTAYIGSAFTVQKERGLGVMFFCILHAISYLIENTEHKKAILTVYSGTPGAKHFYQRFGLKIIHDAAPNNLLRWILCKYSALSCSIR